MSKRRRLRCSGWRRQTNQGNRHDREIEHDRNGQQASGEEGGGGEFSRFTEQGCCRRTADRRSKALIHGRAIGASHARLARRWASRLVRPLLHALSAVLAALRRRAYQSGNRGSARNSGCCCSPPEIGATFNSLLAVSARLMRVMHRPNRSDLLKAGSRKGSEIFVKHRARQTPTLPLNGILAVSSSRPQYSGQSVDRSGEGRHHAAAISPALCANQLAQENGLYQPRRHYAALASSDDAHAAPAKQCQTTACRK